MGKPGYKTQLDQWKRELSAELHRDISYEEIAEATGLSYSTLIKHRSHSFTRPDLATAAKIVAYFNEKSDTPRSTMEYFVEESEEGQGVAVPA